MSFKFDFFAEDDNSKPASVETRTDNHLDAYISLPPQIDVASGRVLHEEVCQFVSPNPEVNAYLQHDLPAGILVWTLNGGLLSESDQIARSTDVMPGQYEGGFKIWECSFDAISCLASTSPPPRTMLDLGCGAGAGARRFL